VSWGGGTIGNGLGINALNNSPAVEQVTYFPAGAALTAEANIRYPGAEVTERAVMNMLGDEKSLRSGGNLPNL
jgi:hypothetical protein